VEKILAEQINKREYQKAIASAISATTSANLKYQLKLQMPIVMTDDIESLKRSKEVMDVLESINLSGYINDGSRPHLRKGIRRSTRIKIYKRKLLLVVGKESSVLKAARNIAGVDVCEVSKITANLLAPGGTPGRMTIWSESAINNLDSAIMKLKV
jgi:large subunit ribosomal protein L4e